MSAKNGKAEEVHQIDLERIHPSPSNPRKHFDPEALQELASSIQAQGVLQPVLLRPAPGWELAPNLSRSKGFIWENLQLQALGGWVKTETDSESTRPLELVAGERRVRAARLAGLKLIPAILRDMTDRQVLEAQLVENEQRADATAIERADAYAELVEKHHVSPEDVAAQIGRSVSTVRNLLKLRQLPGKAREKVSTGELSVSAAVLLARIPGQEAREKATEEALAGFHMDGQPMSFRETASMIECRYTVELKQAPFSQADKKLLPSAGSCKDCPRRVGNLQIAEPEEYRGARADVCVDPDCYRQKCAAHVEREKTRLAREGIAFVEQADWSFQNAHARLDEPCWDLWEEGNHDDEPEDAQVPTWGELLAGRLDADRIAAPDRGGELQLYVPREKALELLAPEEAAREAKARTAAGPSEWDVNRRASEMALETVRARLMQMSAGHLPPGFGQVVNLMAAMLMEKECDCNPEDLRDVFARHQIACAEGQDDQPVEDLELPAVRKWLDEGATGAQALALCADVIVTRAWSMGWRGREKDGAVKDLLAAAGVDEKQLQKDAKAELKKAAKEQGKKARAGGKNGKHDGAEASAIVRKVASEEENPVVRGRLDRIADDLAGEPVRRCRVCGCTEEDCSDCIARTGQPCSWVEEDLCSACAVPVEPGGQEEAPKSRRKAK